MILTKHKEAEQYRVYRMINKLQEENYETMNINKSDWIKMATGRKISFQTIVWFLNIETNEI